MYLLLFLDDVGQLCVGDAGVQLTLHQCRSLIVLDVAQISALGHLDVLGEALDGWRVKTQSISQVSPTFTVSSPVQSTSPLTSLNIRVAGRERTPRASAKAPGRLFLTREEKMLAGRASGK